VNPVVLPPVPTHKVFFRENSPPFPQLLLLSPHFASEDDFRQCRSNRVFLFPPILGFPFPPPDTPFPCKTKRTGFPSIERFSPYFFLSTYRRFLCQKTSCLSTATPSPPPLSSHLPLFPLGKPIRPDFSSLKFLRKGYFPSSSSTSSDP